MRTLLLVLCVLVLGACPRANTGTMPGAPAPRAALDGFLNAVRAQDLQAMSNYWGTASGPARDRLDRTELERRELIMQCHLAHNRVRVVDEMAREGGRRVYSVELTYGTVSRTTTITTIQGPSERWYVENADLTKTQALCEARTAGSAAPR